MELLRFLPQILALLNNPTVQAVLPLLAQLGTAAFPDVKQGKAADAAASLFDVNNVKWVQTALKALGEPIDVDGAYGDATKEAVRRFQAAHNLTVDGWAGQSTNDALRAALLTR